MLGKPFEAANVVYIPTASVAEAGSHSWFVADLNRVHNLGWREFDILELNGLPRRMVLDRLLRADVIYTGGGNHYHLARSITGNGRRIDDLQSTPHRTRGLPALLHRRRHGRARQGRQGGRRF